MQYSSLSIFKNHNNLGRMCERIEGQFSSGHVSAVWPQTNIAGFTWLVVWAGAA